MALAIISIKNLEYAMNIIYNKIDLQWEVFC